MQAAAEIVAAYSDAARMDRPTVTVTLLVENSAVQKKETAIKDKMLFRQWMIT